MKITLTLLIFFTIYGSLSALTPSDPQDQIYKDLARWEAQGLTGPLPSLKPYNLKFIQSILVKVAAGAGSETHVAASYLEEITPLPQFSRSRFVGEFQGALGGSNYSLQPLQGDLDSFTLGGFYFGTNCIFNDWANITGTFGAIGMDQGRSREGKGTAFSIGTRSKYDYFIDDSAFEIKDRVVLATLSMGGIVAFGNENLWFQAGLHRSSFGPFENGMVLTEQAPQASAFSFTWNTPNLIYTKYLIGIAATRDNQTFHASFQNFYPNKYLSGQSFQFLLSDSMEVSLFEEIVFGQRLETYYLLPVISTLYTSIYTGMKDNIFVGGSLRYKLPGNVRLTALFNADDLHFLKLFMLDTSGKTKIAFNAGIDWSPAKTWLDNVALDYSLVTPYTFTHSTEPIDDIRSGINYVNYTHQGKGLVGLEPNSDRLRLKAFWKGDTFWDATLTSQLSRHGNASSDFVEYGVESIKYIGTSDGGFNDNGYVSPGGTHRYDSNHFLTQSIIETLWKTGLEGAVYLKSVLGLITFKGSYALEMGWNRRSLEQTGMPPLIDGSTTLSWTNQGSPLSGNDGLLHFFGFSFSVSF